MLHYFKIKLELAFFSKKQLSIEVTFSQVKLKYHSA